MQNERFEKIFEAVVVRGFYEVSNEGFLESDISHAEMVEVLKMARTTFAGGKSEARIRVGGIVQDLSKSIKLALEKTVKETLPESDSNRNAIFQKFSKVVSKDCDEWVQVSLSNVEVD